MNYRKMAVEVVKIVGQEIVDRAEELIPNAESFNDIDIRVCIKSLSEVDFRIPEIQVNTDANIYLKNEAIEKISNMILEEMQSCSK